MENVNKLGSICGYAFTYTPISLRMVELIRSLKLNGLLIIASLIAQS